MSNLRQPNAGRQRLNVDHWAPNQAPNENVEVGEREIRSALERALSELATELRTIIDQAVRRETDRVVNRSRSRRNDAALVLDRVHHHAPTSDASKDIDIDPATIRAALADVLPTLARQARIEIVASFRRR